jgi:hypothetical protein
MCHRVMIAIIDKVQNNALDCVRGHGKADGISATVCGQASAAMRVPQVAEVAQSVVIWDDFSFHRAGAAAPAEACAQWQPARKRPAHGQAFFLGKEVRTSHSDFILVAARRIV